MSESQISEPKLELPNLTYRLSQGKPLGSQCYAAIMKLSWSKRNILLFTTLLLLGILAGCRNETQNRIRRDLQDFTGGRMYITVYALNGTPVHQGLVDGKVTRSVSEVTNGAATQPDGYVYWYDPSGQYFQTDMQYLLSSKPQAGQEAE